MMESKTKQDNPQAGEQEFSASRRALLHAGWAVPLVLAIATPTFASDGSVTSGKRPKAPSAPGLGGSQSQASGFFKRPTDKDLDKDKRNPFKGSGLFKHSVKIGKNLDQGQ